MTINDIINGPEGAQNSSKQQNAGIQMPANNSYQQSLYIAAISKSLGLEGLVSPVTDVRKGVEYAFNFYHPEAQRLVKVFQTYDKESYRQYSKHPKQPIIIFDAASIPHQLKECECGCGYSYLHVSESAFSESVRWNDRAYIYHDGDLWKCHASIDGEWRWKQVMPVVLQQFVDEDDAPEDDEE